mmetsp:Transcript_599/g.2148  ORF Transcript_599/g.2148 Transcript_599/m.2148 type:complete len:151 (+) Transcript_599:57-509(+)
MPCSCRWLRSKCHPLYYDTIINSRETIVLNIYQEYLLAMLKLRAYLKVSKLQLSKQELVNHLENCISYKYAQIRLLRREYGTVFKPPMDVLRWILYKAAAWCLKGKQNVLHGVAVELEKASKNDRYATIARTYNVSVSPSRSCAFKSIKI